MRKIFTLSLLIFLLIPSLRTASEEKQASELFSQAYAFYSQENHPKAEELFLKALRHGSVLDDYSLYFLGMIALSREDLDGARAYFSKLKTNFSQSVWFHHANLELARISLAKKDYDKASKQLRALATRRVKSPIFEEALYLLGLTYEERGELNHAYSSYQRLRDTSPLTPWAATAKKEMQRMRERYRQLFGLTEPEAILGEGKLLSRERDYVEAERVYRKLSGLTLQRGIRLRFLTGLAEVYHKARKRGKERRVLTEIVEQYPASPEAPTALARLAELSWNRGKNLKALAEFRRLKERYPESPELDFASFASARIYESLQRPDEAIRLYQNFPKEHPQSALREQAAWRLAWMHYLQANYSQAHDDFEHIAAGIGSRNFRTGGLFWQARTAERLGRLEKAKHIYRNILNAQDDSYYMEPAANALKKMGETVKKRKATKGHFSSDATPPRSPNISFHLSRAKKLAEFSLHDLAVVELDEIKNQIGENSALRMTLIQEYVRNRGFDRSVKLAYQLYDPSGELKHYSYPLAYWETVQKNAVKRGLDPYLVLALVRQESLFDSQALSPASAFGLMQLLPSTAGQEAKRMGLPPPEIEKLYDPDLNIILGTQHLKGLLQIYSNNIVKAVAAYNAGKNAVDRWERKLSALDQEEFIERITYRETRLYVKLVLRNYWIYKNLYDNPDEKTVQK